MSNVIALYCDGGGKKVLLIDTHLNRFLFSKLSKKARYVGEYRAIFFTLKYIEKTYKDSDIVIITDGKSEVDVLNGNSSHHKNQVKEFSEGVKALLVKVRTFNIVNIIWLPREENDAGVFLQRFHNEKHKSLMKKHSVEYVDYNSLEVIKPIA